MRHAVVLALVTTALTTVAQAQPYRCSVDGKAVYQQTPCEGGKPVNMMGAGAADPASPGALQAQREIAEWKRRERAEKAILEGSVYIGMAEKDVVKSWGRPTSVNTTITAGGRRQQWVYRWRGRRAQYVYLADGVVTAIQSSE